MYKSKNYTHYNNHANWHPPYPSQHGAAASPNRRFRGSNPRAEITETQQYAISYLVTSSLTQLHYTDCPIHILTTTHSQIGILHTRLNIELQLLQIVDSVVQIQERKSRNTAIYHIIIVLFLFQIIYISLLRS